MAKENKITPSTNDNNGRRPNGRFAEGNPGGPGNPHAAAVGAWRTTLINAVTVDDMRQVIDVLTDKAKKGEAWAVKELLDRCLGKSQQKVEIETSGKMTWAMMIARLHQQAETP
ncbi:MAG: hypothetical protein HQ546_01595 [Planctomycetes bacterium]|nr:hypothetical protein [Planctomycetota bacterium]